MTLSRVTIKTTWFSSRRLNSKFLPALLALALCIPFFVPSDNAFASKNGVIQKDNPFAVGITFNFGMTPQVCSGVLIAPTLIATAGHCISDANGIKGTDYIFTAPMQELDAAIDPSKPAPKIKKIILPPNFANNSEGTVDDIAFIQLDIPLATKGAISIASKTEVTSLAAKSLVSGYGYGAVYESGAGYSPLPRKYLVRLQNPVLTSDTKTSVMLFSDSSTSCSGDSGGPITATLSTGKEVVIGILDGALTGSGLCGAQDSDGFYLMRATLIYPYLSLINSLLVIPTPTPTVTKKIIKITCVKGKLTKTVSGTNPKCPTGYTRKK